ncbi:binding partner of ACD11 1-like [Silene latifolia]|uniref:binding partner of ACD11 1-like n=1 Tax=Silene latifolia TaxID=37657 RepID=UPI003D785819
MSVKTVKVSNVSHKASERELKEFFSFSGDIEFLEIKSEDEETLTAYVTFKDSQGADTAVLLTGATIVDKTVSISLDPDYELPPGALAQAADGQNPQSALRKAEDVVSSMLAKGFILGKDAVGKAKSFDDKHKLTSTASLKIASLDQKIGFTEKISMGTSAVNNKVKEMDQKFQVSEKTKTAYSVAEEKVSNAGSAIMKNRYVLTGATWVTGAFNKVAKAASEVGQKTKEKVGKVEDEHKREMVDDSSRVHLSAPDSQKADTLKTSASPTDPPPAYTPLSEEKPAKPEPAQGLIL